MEKTSSNTLSTSFSLADLLGFFLFDGVIKCVIGFKMFCSSYRYVFQFQVEFFFGKPEKRESPKLDVATKMDHEVLSRKDVEIVMEKIRIACNDNQEMMTSQELSALFEDMEPSLQEVKEAFDVFDANGDGFVDATELQRVLCSLGYKEGSKVEECEKMIRAFDVNRDGRIDFNEFVKLMENSFC